MSNLFDDSEVIESVNEQTQTLNDFSHNTKSETNVSEIQ